MKKVKNYYFGLCVTGKTSLCKVFVKDQLNNTFRDLGIHYS